MKLIRTYNVLKNFSLGIALAICITPTLNQYSPVCWIKYYIHIQS